MARRPSLGIPVCLGLIAAFLPALAAGQPASLLLDVNTTSYDYDHPPWKGDIRGLRAAGNRLYFMAAGGGAGTAMWVSDGTSTGTGIVHDLCTGGVCSVQPDPLGGLGKLMLWTAESSSIRRQLWRSDGTRPGTFALTEPDLEVTGPNGPYAFFGRSLYFVGCSGSGAERDCDLWRTDGSIAGTRIFHNVPRSFVWLQVAGDRLYYLDYENGLGSSLWVTDGTAAGTVRLHRFSGSPDDSQVPTSAGGRLFFLAKEDGEEIWTSDGTVAGTRPVTKFSGAVPFGYTKQLRPIGNRLYFIADDGVHAWEIWRTDGTAAGTIRLTEFEHVSPFASSESFVAEVRGIVVFTATDGQSPYRLWTSRGTPESTAPLAFPCDDCRMDPYADLVESGGKVFFLVTHEYSYTPELWTTDGTAAGSRRAYELCLSCSSDLLFPWKGGVLLTHRTYLGTQIWFSDGTPAGTRPFIKLAGAVLLDDPFEMAEIGSNFYFFAEGETKGLWVRDAQGKTQPVRTLPITGPTSKPDRLTALGDRLLFTAWDGLSTSGLWSSAGTPETTGFANLPDISWEDATAMVRVGGLLFFQVGETYEPHNLWRTDGTPQGTFVVAHLQAKAVMVPFQGSLYFFDGGWIWKTDGTVQGTVKTGEFPAELLSVEFAAPGPNGIYLKTVTAPYKSDFWFTDGTTAGTRQLTNFNRPGVAEGDAELTSSGSFMYFSWDFHLWKSDGTMAGTTIVEGLPANEFPTRLISHHGTLYFFTSGFTSEHPLRLWRTDGTTVGTVQLAEFPSYNTFEFPQFRLKLTPFAGKLFFDVDDGVHGFELWSTDGTPAGTTLLRDLRPGPRSSWPSQFTIAGGRLFFTASDDLHGAELWQTDGSAAGARLVQDIGPQAVSAFPSQLTVAGNKLFFTADDGVTGREVWVLPFSASSACQASPTRLCLRGGRYAVEATWRDFLGRRGVGHAVPLTADTGYFWFFDAANVEAVLKVLDGRSVNGHAWVFYGALSTVEYTLTVTDTETGLAHRYINPPGTLASVGDTMAFGPFGATLEAAASSVSSPSPLALVDHRIVPGAATGSCAPSSTRLCLNNARFAVEIAWKDFQGHTGTGKAVELSADTGWFWFFDPANVEIVLKVLDGRPVNGHHWVFYGALSSVEYTITVTDTQTGEINTYKNPGGRLASVADTRAF